MVPPAPSLPRHGLAAPGLRPAKPAFGAMGCPRGVASRAVGATPKTVTIVGAPLDLGQGRRGVDMGPSAIRYAGLEERLSSFGCHVVDRGNVATPEPESLAVS